jgi:c(7)-type cytochrome triheme protein
MSRLFLFVLVVLCVGCGSAPKSEEKAAVKEAPKVAAKATSTFAAGQTAPSPPETILFPSEYGNVTYTHRKHYERVNGDCATCHAKTFPMALEPLNYGKARHRSAEEYGTSCATCHGIKATAFAAERNCQKCHDLGYK